MGGQEAEEEEKEEEKEEEEEEEEEWGTRWVGAGGTAACPSPWGGAPKGAFVSCFGVFSSKGLLNSTESSHSKQLLQAQA